MAKLQLYILFGALFSANCCLANYQETKGFFDVFDTPFEPFLPDRSELLRFSRAAKGGLFAKYEQRQLEKQQLQEQQQLQQQQQQQQQQELRNEESPQVEVKDREVQSAVAAEMPSFGAGQAQSQTSADSASSSQTTNDSFDSSLSPPAPSSPVSSSPSSPSSPVPASSSSSSSSGSQSAKSSRSKTVTTTTTTTTQQQNQEPPRVAHLREVRVHTVPLSQAVHYANYVVVPTVNQAGGSSQAARLEESSSSSSSSQKSSSSSSSTTSQETEAVAAVPAPPTTVVLPPVVSQNGPDCQVFQRLIVERPVSSQVVVEVPSSVSVSQHSSSSHSSRVVEQSAPAPVPVSYVVKTIQPAPVYTAKLVLPQPAPTNDGVKEETFHSESRSSRQQSHGGHLSSSSSSSSSSSRSSKSSTTSSQTSAALVAPSPPVVHKVTLYQSSGPVFTVPVKSAPLVASRGSNSYSVDVDHHYSGPNVKYGYSIKQQSSEPETKGLLVGERVVYLKK